MPQTVIHLVRHGHVENPGRVLYGRLPGFNLSERGRAQAEVLGRYFAPVPLAAVWSSPLERAQQTAAAIAAPHGLPVRTDERLLEASNVFEGAAGNLLWYVVRHPRVWWHLRDRHAPSWGERNIDLASRMQEVVTDARTELAGQVAALVSHQAPIWVARLALERRRLGHWPGARQCALASVTTFAFEADKLMGVTYAEPAVAVLEGIDPGRAGA